MVSRLSIKEKASQLGHAEVIQKDMASADGEFDTFLKVSLDDVKRVAQKYFVPEGRMVMRIMPRGGSGGEVTTKTVLAIVLFGGLTGLVAATPALDRAAARRQARPCARERSGSADRESNGRATIRRGRCRRGR